MNRRSFISSILATCAAPAIVRADSLMRVVPWDTTIINPFDPLGQRGYVSAVFMDRAVVLNSGWFEGRDDAYLPKHEFNGELGHIEEMRFVLSPFSSA